MMAGRNKQMGLIWPKDAPAGTGSISIKWRFFDDFFKDKLSFTSFGIWNGTLLKWLLTVECSKRLTSGSPVSALFTVVDLIGWLRMSQSTNGWIRSSPVSSSMKIRSILVPRSLLARLEGEKTEDRKLFDRNRLPGPWGHFPDVHCAHLMLIKRSTFWYEDFRNKSSKWDTLLQFSDSLLPDTRHQRRHRRDN